MSLRITVELLPHGDENRKQKIAVVSMSNDGTGTVEKGNYDVVAEGQTVGGYDTFFSGKIKNVIRGDYFRQAVAVLNEINK